MLLRLIKRSAPLRKCLVWAGKGWIYRKVEEISNLAGKEGTILDIGSGNCLAAEQLLKRGYSITCVDVADLSVSDIVRPIVYDGIRLPFPDQSFDVALLVSVLHHTHDPRVLLMEARRVARRILILEDTYLNPVQYYLTLAADTVVNMGHSSMTYQNRNEEGWSEMFRELGLQVSGSYSRPALGIFRQTWFDVYQPACEG